MQQTVGYANHISNIVSNELKLTMDNLSEQIRNLTDNIATLFIDNKGEDLLQLFPNDCPAIDCPVLVITAASNRHAQTLSEKVLRLLKDSPLIKDIKVDGLPTANWVAIDAGHLIIHIFLAQVRDYYQIEKIWNQSPKDMVNKKE